MADAANPPLGCRCWREAKLPYNRPCWTNPTTRRRHRLLTRCWADRADRRARRVDRLLPAPRRPSSRPIREKAAGRFSARRISARPTAWSTWWLHATRCARRLARLLPPADQVAGRSRPSQKPAPTGPSIRPRSFSAPEGGGRPHRTRETRPPPDRSPSLDELIARLSAPPSQKPIDLGLDRMHALLARLDHSRTQTAAGDPYRRHQWQGFDHRLLARRSWRPQDCAASTSIPSPHSGADSTNAIASAATVAARWVGDDETGAPLFEHLRAGQLKANRSRFFEAEDPRRPFLVVSRSIRPMPCCWKSGLGGRLDATNVIDAPARDRHFAPVQHGITRNFLGNSLSAIAGEKAAIIKAQRAGGLRPRQAPEAMAVIEAEAKRMRAPLAWRQAQQWHVKRRARPVGLSGRSRPDGPWRRQNCSGRPSVSTMPGLCRSAWAPWRRD